MTFLSQKRWNSPEMQFIRAARWGDLEAVRATLDQGISVETANDFGGPPLLEAVAHRYCYRAS